MRHVLYHYGVWSLAGTFLFALVLCLPACAGATSAASVPTPNLTLVSAVSQKVAVAYGEQHPTLVSVKTTLTDNDQQPMDAVLLRGIFHKGSLQATQLSFSMLATGKQVWAVRATNDQNQQMWLDDTFAI